ncbi:MAG: hypothetical protein ACE14T_11945 [Syntrophales bacterium]
MSNLSEAFLHYEEGLEAHYQSGLDARDRREEWQHKTVDNLCSELDNAKLILGDRKKSHREKCVSLNLRLAEIMDMVDAALEEENASN